MFDSLPHEISRGAPDFHTAKRRWNLPPVDIEIVNESEIRLQTASASSQFPVAKNKQPARMAGWKQVNKILRMDRSYSS